MGKGNNHFNMDLSLGTPCYNRLPGNNSPVIVRFNLGCALHYKQEFRDLLLLAPKNFRIKNKKIPKTAPTASASAS